MPIYKEEDKKTKLFLKLNYLLLFVIVAAMLFYLFRVPALDNENIIIVVSVSATAIVVFNAIKSIMDRRITVDLLASVALCVSLYERQWVSAAFINLMIVCARAFTYYVEIKSHSAINSLMKLKPEKVKIRENGKIVEIPIGKVKNGDLVIVELGETVPVDGLIEEGEADVDQSSLTGESMPVAKKKGEQALSFTTVVSGNLVVRAEKVGKETTFEKIVELVEKSQENKAPIYTLINIFANWYIVLTITGSFIVYLISRDVTLVLALLLVSCADDIAIATPLALMSAITHSARHGAIVKGGDYLEALSKMNTMVFDKTGTLTKGKLKIEKVRSFKEEEEKNVIKFASAVSSLSTHPIAKTIIEYAKKENIPEMKTEKFEEYSGRGMTAVYKGELIVTGKLAFLQKMGIKITPKEIEEINTEELKGLNVTLVGYNNELFGYVALTDELRPRAKETVEQVKKLGVKRTVMLTGDNEKIAKKTATILGIDEFHANLLPREKLIYLKKYLSRRHKVAMVGDGVNDAPTLALADVGIAMGAIGSDAAIEAADIAIMKDDLSQIPELMKIGRATINVIRENLIMWGILNVLGFGLVFLRILTPDGAAAWNFITDFIPIINSLRLFR